MKTKCLLLLFVVLSASMAFADQYWVAIGNDNYPNLPIFLMQIDELGNVIMAPKAVIPDSALPPGGGFDERTVALAYSTSGDLLVWVGQDSTSDLTRFTLDPDTLKILSHKKIYTQGTGLDFLQTEQPFSDFLVTDRKEYVLSGLPVDGKGNISGSPFRVVPRFEGEYHESSIAADGGMIAMMSFGDAHIKLAVQPLKPTGLPNGTPQVSSAPACTHDVDITSMLSNGRRFVVYNDCDADHLILQAVDGATGAKKGTQKQLTSLTDGEQNQAIAIDPQGRFVIFNVEGDVAGCSGVSNDPLFFVPIHPNTGDALAAPMQITSCDLYDPYNPDEGIGQFGIDILKVQ